VADNPTAILLEIRRAIGDRKVVQGRVDWIAVAEVDVTRSRYRPHLVTLPVNKNIVVGDALHGVEVEKEGRVAVVKKNRGDEACALETVRLLEAQDLLEITACDHTVLFVVWGNILVQVGLNLSRRVQAHDECALLGGEVRVIRV